MRAIIIQVKLLNIIRTQHLAALINPSTAHKTHCTDIPIRLKYKKKPSTFRHCESPHSAAFQSGIAYCQLPIGERTISTDEAFDDCVILSKDTFDPDAVFLDDIVDDDVLPYLSLAVDGLNTRGDANDGKLELRPGDVAEAANAAIKASTTMPVAVLGVDHLEVYGWEPSLWRKIKGYFSA